MNFFSFFFFYIIFSILQTKTFFFPLFFFSFLPSPVSECERLPKASFLRGGGVSKVEIICLLCCIVLFLFGNGGRKKKKKKKTLASLLLNSGYDLWFKNSSCIDFFCAPHGNVEIVGCSMFFYFKFLFDVFFFFFFFFFWFSFVFRPPCDSNFQVLVAH